MLEAVHLSRQVTEMLGIMRSRGFSVVERGGSEHQKKQLPRKLRPLQQVGDSWLANRNKVMLD